MLTRRNVGGEDIVVFLAGGGGSGKTTAVEELPVVSRIRELAHIVYDTTMAHLDSSDNKVKEALANNKEVIIFYVHRPYDLAARGMVRRALRSGRTVPADILASDHYNAQRTFLELYERYRHDSRVDFRLIDNGGGLDQIRLMSVDFSEFLRNNLYWDLSALRADVRWAIRDEFWRVVGDEHSTQKGGHKELHKCVYRAIFGEELGG